MEWEKAQYLSYKNYWLILTFHSEFKHQEKQYYYFCQVKC